LIAGNISDGFKETFATYIIDALSTPGHCYVILLTTFLAGLMALMEKSGGMKGFTVLCSSYATNPNLAQLTCYAMGILLFFDDYPNILLSGQTLRPLFDAMHISREKLAFIISVMGPSVVILSPISSWIGFEINLIQPQLDRIMRHTGTMDIGIETSAFGVFLHSIQYQYYSIYMIVQVLFVVLLRHDFGWMLYAERKVAIFERTDGGIGKGKAKSGGNDPACQPNENVPSRAYNMFVPIAILVGSNQLIHVFALNVCDQIDI
jgi:Na+/H+ antiporter NhaC